MLRNTSRILPFLMVTLLAIGGVELFYKAVEHYMEEPAPQAVRDNTVPSAGAVSEETAERHQNYDIIVERNLFQSYLDEPVPEQETQTTANPLEGLEETTLDLVLMGTISGEEGLGRAIILNKRENQQEIYYRGDVIEGAEIKEILRGKVILNYEGKDEILDMSEAASMRPRDTGAPEPFRETMGNQIPPPPRQRVVPNEQEEVYEEAVEPEPLALEPGPVDMNGEPLEPVEEQDGGLPVPPQSINDAGEMIDQENTPLESSGESAI